MVTLPTCKRCSEYNAKFYRLVLSNGMEHCLMKCVCGFTQYVDKRLLCRAEPGIYLSRKQIKQQKKQEVESNNLSMF